MAKKIQYTLGNIIGAQTTKARLMAHLDDLPSSPAIALEIEKIAADPNYKTPILEKSIKKDEALAAKLLRLVNSAFFGLSKPVTSLTRAILMVGKNTIRNMVFTLSTSQLLMQNVPVYGYKRLGLWTHSIGGGIAASALGEKLGATDGSKEELFVAGLLHDMGKLVLAKFLSSATPEQKVILNQGSPASLDVERELTGFDHAELGLVIAQRWKLSEMLGEIIRWHHAPSMAQTYPHGAFLVHLGDICIRRMGLGFERDQPKPTTPDVAAMKRFQFNTVALDSMALFVAEEFEKQKIFYSLQEQ